MKKISKIIAETVNKSSPDGFSIPEKVDDVLSFVEEIANSHEARGLKVYDHKLRSSTAKINHRYYTYDTPGGLVKECSKDDKGAFQWNDWLVTYTLDVYLQ